MFGSQRPVVARMYPEDSLQFVFGNPDWWIKTEDTSLARGSLIFAFIPHIDQVPYAFEAIGRDKATDHSHAKVNIAPLKVNQPLKQKPLPVAAMPTFENEAWTAYRAKKRPCLIVGSENTSVKSKLTQGMPNSVIAPTIQVAPYYGADKKSSYNRPEFIERIRHCNYPHYVWDILPMDSGKESILRLDQLQAIGAHHDSYKHTGFCLSEDALGIIDELITCLIWGGLPEDGDVIEYRNLIKDTLEE